jgi:hypothetical protein
MRGMYVSDKAFRRYTYSMFAVGFALFALALIGVGRV